MEINIENCKSIDDYLILCHVKSIDDLTKDQLLAWARSGKMGQMTRFSVSIVENGMFGMIPDMDKAIKNLKQALLEKKEFYCSYVEDESCDGPNKTEHEYFEMDVR